MRTIHFAMPISAAFSLVLAGCAAGGAAPAASAPPSSGATSAAVSASASPSSSASGSAQGPDAAGTLSMKAPKCSEIKRPKSWKLSMAAPGTMCAFESASAYMAFRVASSNVPASFDSAAVVARSGSPSVVVEQVAAEGWSFGARWPLNGNFARVQYWLVDAKRNVLECRTGSDAGAAELQQLLAACNEVKGLLLKP